MFSNGHVGEIESPFDSNVTISSQLEESLLAGLDVLFVTNHNTLDGYNQIINYKNINKAERKIFYHLKKYKIKYILDYLLFQHSENQLKSQLKNGEVHGISLSKLD